MQPQQALEQFLAQHKEWVAPAIGVAAALLVFAIGRLWVVLRARSRRRTIPLPAPNIALKDPDGDLFAQGSNVERRASLRRSGNAVAIQISDAEATAKPHHGWVIDRSMGGLCLSVQEAVAAGTILSIRPSNAPVTVPWIQVEVRNCRSVGIDWELGCQFVRTPPWSVLLLFG